MSLLRATATAAIAATLAASGAHAQASPLTVEQARTLIAPFYDMLNTPADKNIPALADKVLAADWKSYSSETEFRQ